MNCWHCKTELIWGGDFDYEDYGIDRDGIVSNLSCPNYNLLAIGIRYIRVGVSCRKES